MKVTAILKGRTDQNGQIPIQIRVNFGNRRTFHPTGMRVDKTQFKNGRVTGHPKTAEYNEEIKRLIILHQAKNIDGLQKKVAKVDFYAYLQKCIDEWEWQKTDGTMKVYKSLGKIVKAFRPLLSLHEIDLTFLDSFKRHRLAMVAPNTVWSNLTRLKAVVNKAHREGLITTNPFLNFKMQKYRDPEKVYLTKEELQKIESFLMETPAYHLPGYWFLIACHTGMRVSDILRFTKKNIVNGQLIFRTKKTSDTVSLPVEGALLRFFEAIDYKPVGCVEQTYRNKIKIVVAAAKVKKQISTHTARHTAAILMMNAGLRQEMVAKILGQKDLRSTRVYAKIVNLAVKDDFGRFLSSLD